MTAVVASRRFAASSGGGKPAPYLDTLDSMWNGAAPAADAAAVAVAASPPAASFVSSMITTIGSATGLEAPLCILVVGFLFRLATLACSLYGERAAERMQAVIPLLKPKLDRFHRMRETERAAAVHIASTELKVEVRRVYKDHGTSNVKAATGLLGSPLVLYGFAGVTKLCVTTDTVDSIGQASFLWCPVLAWADPMYVLPTLSVALTLANFEMALRVRNTLQTTWVANLLLSARAMALISLAGVSQLPSGILLYWIGLSLAGLLQPVLLRSAGFRRAFGFPAREALTAATMDPLQARIALKIPMMRELYDPQLEEEVAPTRMAKDYSSRQEMQVPWRK